jgi:hypothetical protein
MDDKTCLIVVRPDLNTCSDLNHINHLHKVFFYLRIDSQLVEDRVDVSVLLVTVRRSGGIENLKSPCHSAQPLVGGKGHITSLQSGPCSRSSYAQ